MIDIATLSLLTADNTRSKHMGALLLQPIPEGAVLALVGAQPPPAAIGQRKHLSIEALLRRLRLATEPYSKSVCNFFVHALLYPARRRVDRWAESVQVTVAEP